VAGLQVREGVRHLGQRVRSITGVTVPASSIPASTTRSSPVGVTVKLVNACETNGDRTRSATMRPSAPTTRPGESPAV
jgi:hypothetical protein